MMKMKYNCKYNFDVSKAFRWNVKAVFHLNRIVGKRTNCILLFREYSGRTDDMHTTEYATFCYDASEVKNRL